MKRKRDQAHRENARSGTVDNRDVLQANEWDRDGAGEIDGSDTSSVGANPKPDDEHTSAGN